MAESSAFNDAVTSVTEQFVTVLNVPVPFLLVVGTVAFAIWKFLGHHYEGRLSIKDELLALRDAQLGDYKDKFDGATPDAIKARMDALEERINGFVPQIAALGPRRITAEQRRAIVQVLDGQKGSHISIASDAASADAAQISKGLVAAFNSAAWHVQTPMVLGLSNPPHSGIGLKVANTAKLTAREQCVADALKAGGLDFDLQAAGARLPIPGEAAIEIILTTQALD